MIGIQPEAIDYSSARHTVKGIAMKGNLILLLESNRGDYTFPGGGIESGESHQETLSREVSDDFIGGFLKRRTLYIGWRLVVEFKYLVEGKG